MTSIRGRRPAHPRLSARLAALGTALGGMFCLAVAFAAPVAAAKRDDGDDPGEPMSKLEALLIFGVIPLGLILLITLLVSLPWLLKGQRKPGTWDAAPEWYGAPEDAPEVEGGHGAQPALSGRVLGTGTDGGEDDGGDGGGSSARW